MAKSFSDVGLSMNRVRLWGLFGALFVVRLGVSFGPFVVRLGFCSARVSVRAACLFGTGFVRTKVFRFGFCWVFATGATEATGATSGNG